MINPDDHEKTAEELYKNAKKLGVKSSNPDAVHLCKLASEKGHAQASFTLAKYYDRQLSNEIDRYAKGVIEEKQFRSNRKTLIETKEHYYELAIEQGSTQAKSDYLYRCYQNARFYEDQKKAESAVKYYQKAAKYGHVESLYYLALMYEGGRGIERNDQEAVRLLELAADQGFEVAQHRLAVKYESGQGVEQDQQKAVNYLLLVANKYLSVPSFGRYQSSIVTEARYNLAVRYEKGHGVEPSEKNAIRFHRAAANAEHPLAQVNLARRYAKGQGVEKNEQRAASLYENAARKENAQARYKLATWCEVGRSNVYKDDKRAVCLLKLAAEQGVAKAQYNLAVRHKEGRGVEKNEQEAVRLLKLAASGGVAQAQHDLAVRYEDGRGVEKNEQEAGRLYQSAGEQGQIGAKFSLFRRSTVTFFKKLFTEESATRGSSSTVEYDGMERDRIDNDDKPTKKNTTQPSAEPAKDPYAASSSSCRK